MSQQPAMDSSSPLNSFAALSASLSSSSSSSPSPSSRSGSPGAASSRRVSAPSSLAGAALRQQAAVQAVVSAATNHSNSAPYSLPSPHPSPLPSAPASSLARHASDTGADAAPPYLITTTTSSSSDSNRSASSPSSPSPLASKRASVTSVASATSAAFYSHTNISTSSVVAPNTSLRRNKDMHAKFPEIPDDELLIDDYMCALSRGPVPIQGRAYLTHRRVCFYSAILGTVHRVAIHFEDIDMLKRRAVAGFIPNAIEIVSGATSFIFQSFLSREAAFDKMRQLWLSALAEARSNDNLSYGAVVDEVNVNSLVIPATPTSPAAATPAVASCAAPSDRQPSPENVVSSASIVKSDSADDLSDTASFATGRNTPTQSHHVHGSHSGTDSLPQESLDALPRMPVKAKSQPSHESLASKSPRPPSPSETWKRCDHNQKVGSRSLLVDDTFATSVHGMWDLLFANMGEAPDATEICASMPLIRSDSGSSHPRKRQPHRQCGFMEWFMTTRRGLLDLKQSQWERPPSEPGASPASCEPVCFEQLQPGCTRKVTYDMPLGVYTSKTTLSEVVRSCDGDESICVQSISSTAGIPFATTQQTVVYFCITRVPATDRHPLPRCRLTIAYDVEFDPKAQWMIKTTVSQGIKSRISEYYADLAQVLQDYTTKKTELEQKSAGMYDGGPGMDGMGSTRSSTARPSTAVQGDDDRESVRRYRHRHSRTRPTETALQSGSRRGSATSLSSDAGHGAKWRPNWRDSVLAAVKTPSVVVALHVMSVAVLFAVLVVLACCFIILAREVSGLVDRVERLALLLVEVGNMQARLARELAAGGAGPAATLGTLS